MGREESNKFIPVEGKKIVTPIMRNRNPMVEDPSHEAYFLFANSTISYCLPMNQNGNLLNPFNSEKEKRWLEEQLAVDLNIYKKDSFLSKHKVKLGKEARVLILSNPRDYLDYLVLKTNNQYIAPNGDEQMKKKTYRYALIDEGYEAKKVKKSVDKKKDAYKIFGKMEDDKEEMLKFLKAYGKKVSENSKINFLVEQIELIVTSDIDVFLTVTQDTDAFDIKVLIADSVDCKALNKSGKHYFLPGGDALCGPGEISSLENAVLYLKQPEHQDIVTMLQTRVSKAAE